jgi:hypothetical protein
MVREQEAKRPRKVTNYAAAFFNNGIMCEHIYDFMQIDPNIIFIQNEIFSDTLEYVGYGSSSSGNSRIFLKSNISKRRYNMFMSDFDEIILASKFKDNKISGKFCFCKKSSAQGIRMVFDQG